MIFCCAAVIPTSLWEGKVTTDRKLHSSKNPGIAVIRKKEPGQTYSNNGPRKGLACLVSMLYAVTAASLIIEHKNINEFNGLYVTYGKTVKNIGGLITHNQYNPENQYEYDIGIIKVSNLTNF